MTATSSTFLEGTFAPVTHGSRIPDEPPGAGGRTSSGCLRHRTLYNEHTAWSHRTQLAA